MKELFFKALLYPLVRVYCFISGHNWFDGGEVCRDCEKPRPDGWGTRGE